MPFYMMCKFGNEIDTEKRLLATDMDFMMGNKKI
jgi:hypothetical protein